MVAHPMALPCDVLFSVLEVQSFAGRVDDVSSMSKTCRTIRHEAVKYLLGHAVRLRDADDIVSFSHFMHGEPDRRYPLLRGTLRIEAGSLSAVAATALYQLILPVSHLTRLVLIHADEIFSSAINMAYAFAALTCIKHLEFHASHNDDYTGCIYLLRNMQSRLITVSLNLPRPLARFVYGYHHCDLNSPMKMLHNSADTLTEFSGTNLEARGSGARPSIFPNVTRLDVELWLMPLIAPYIVAFPNATSVRISCVTQFDELTLPVFRRMNEERQEGGRPWPTLDDLTGTLAHLYMMSLRSRVKALTILSDRDLYPISYLRDVLSQSAPRHLHLELSSSVLNELPYVFRACPVACDIETLDLRVLHGDEMALPMPVLDELLVHTYSFVHVCHLSDDMLPQTLAIDAIEPLSLTSFEIRFAPAPALAPTQATQHVADVHQHILACDVTRHLDHVRRACPSLRRLAVENSAWPAVPRELFALEFGDQVQAEAVLGG